MTMMLSDLLAPVTPEAFFAEYHDRQPLHVQGGAEKFASVLSWAEIDRLLGMTHIWSSQSLKVVVEGQSLPPEQYCTRAMTRDRQQAMQPDAAMVEAWVKRGATLALNDVDSLTPGLAAVSGALEGAGLGKAQANVYVSWQAHKAFASHYDTHEVWAVQVEGEKTWYVWEGRAEWPIAHPAFRPTQAQHEQAKGKLRAEVKLKKGDLLYLPRGWYHDALTESANSVHVAFGVHAPIGMDALTLLADRAVLDPLFRKPLPRQDGSPEARAALETAVASLGDRLAALAREPRMQEAVRGLVADHRFKRGRYDLLKARDGAAPPPARGPAAWRLVATAKPVRRGPDFVLQGPRGNVTLSAAEAEAVAWMQGQARFAEADLARAVPGLNGAALLGRLGFAGALAAA
jgi:ribosomal protein L16 Arg81 hydroxylase